MAQSATAEAETMSFVDYLSGTSPDPCEQIRRLAAWQTGVLMSQRDVSSSTLLTGLSRLQSIPYIQVNEFEISRTYSEQSGTDLAVHAQSIEDIEILVDGLFAAAGEEYFEDGAENNFSRSLANVVETHGKWAMPEIAHLILSGTSNPEVASEALRWLGRMRHAPTHEYRFWLLCKSLGASSLRVRDGALIGMALMEDRRAVSYLRKAAEREYSSVFRRDILQIVADLDQG